MFAPLPSTQSGLAGRFAWLIEGMCQAVAKHIAHDPTAATLIVLIWQALRRRFSRFEALAARFEAGKLLPPRARPARARNKAARPKKPGEISFDRAIADHLLFGSWRLGWITRRPAWLPRLMPDVSLGVSSAHLLGLLDLPEMVALLHAAPQARAMLRPLFRMLSFDPLPDILRPPPRARVPESVAPSTGSETASAVAPKATRRRFRSVPGLARPSEFFSPDADGLGNA